MPLLVKCDTSATAHVMAMAKTMNPFCEYNRKNFRFIYFYIRVVINSFHNLWHFVNWNMLTKSRSDSNLCQQKTQKKRFYLRIKLSSLEEIVDGLHGPWWQQKKLAIREASENYHSNVHIIYHFFCSHLEKYQNEELLKVSLCIAGSSRDIFEWQEKILKAFSPQINYKYFRRLKPNILVFFWASLDSVSKSPHENCEVRRLAIFLMQYFFSLFLRVNIILQHCQHSVLWSTIKSGGFLRSHFPQWDENTKCSHHKFKVNNPFSATPSIAHCIHFVFWCFWSDRHWASCE